MRRCILLGLGGVVVEWAFGDRLDFLMGWVDSGQLFAFLYDQLPVGVQTSQVLKCSSLACLLSISYVIELELQPRNADKLV